MILRQEAITNIIVVTLITLLIWIWAGNETTETRTLYNQQINLKPSSGTSTIVRPKTISKMRIEIRGSRKAVQRMEQKFNEFSSVPLGFPGVPATDGRHTINLLELEQEIANRAEEQVTIQSTQPSTAEIEVIVRSQINANIQPNLPEGARTTGGITVDPPTGTLTLPDTLIREGKTYALSAVLKPQMLENLVPGRRHLLKAEVILPEELLPHAELIEFEPREVEVSVALISSEVEHTIPSVPVQVAAPPADLDRYSVTIAQGAGFLRDVTLRGPPDAISRIEKGETRVVAFVHLTSDNLVQNVTERPVSMWLLPAGVSVVRVGTGNTTTPQVELKIIDNTEP